MIEIGVTCDPKSADLFVPVRHSSFVVRSTMETGNILHAFNAKPVHFSSPSSAQFSKHCRVKSSSRNGVCSGVYGNHYFFFIHQKKTQRRRQSYYNLVILVGLFKKIDQTQGLLGSNWVQVRSRGYGIYRVQSDLEHTIIYVLDGEINSTGLAYRYVFNGHQKNPHE